jgi:hypothetical protein
MIWSGDYACKFFSRGTQKESSLLGWHDDCHHHTYGHAYHVTPNPHRTNLACDPFPLYITSDSERYYMSQ